MSAPVINADPPHVTYTGAACAHCYALKPDLLRCSACMHAWYCNQDCQRAGRKAHKQYCKALKTFHELVDNLPDSAQANTPQVFYQQRLHVRPLLEQQLHRSLSRSEARALFNEAHCSVCCKTRSQLGPAGLTCCPRCSWGWACAMHAKQYMTKGHSHAVCDNFHLMNTAELWVRNMLKVSGKLPSYCPEGIRLPYQPLPAAGWEDYRTWRPTPSLDAAVFAVLTKRLSQPLTALQALQHFYTPKELGSIQQLVLHVVGAGAFEVPADPVWEEVLHLAPPGVKAIHVDFVGPELREVCVPEVDGELMVKTMCPKCSDRGYTRSYAYHLHTYHDFIRRQAAAGTPQKPHLVIAFNCGLHDNSYRDSWQPSLKALVAADSPVAFSSYNKSEAEDDARVWRGVGGQVTRSVSENPYRALEPIMEPAAVDEWYYQNYWWFCGRSAGSSRSSQQAEAPGSTAALMQGSAITAVSGLGSDALEVSGLDESVARNLATLKLAGDALVDADVTKESEAQPAGAACGKQANESITSLD